MPTSTINTGSAVQANTFRDTVETTLTKVVPCQQQWGFFSAPTFALGGLVIAWLTGKSKLYGAGIGGLLGLLISRYGAETPYTKASEVSPALRAAATAAGEAARAAAEAARDAQRAARGLAPSVTPSVNAALVTRMVPRQTVSPEDIARANQQMAERQANNDLFTYCHGTYDSTTRSTIQQHTQECAAGGWRDTIPQFRCFRAPSFNF
jgi:hypothetical protein